MTPLGLTRGGSGGDWNYTGTPEGVTHPKETSRECGDILQRSGQAPGKSVETGAVSDD
jgi:hypothetical protein